MFEKEAEEYCLKRTGYGKDEFHGRKLRQAYESGAEFGYNKAKEENAELDCQKNRNKFCYSCANATERCFKNEIGCPCDKYKSYKDENAELKDEIERDKDLPTIAYLQGAEKQKKKDKVLLTKAKKIIKELVRAVESSYSVLSWQRPPIKAEAEQFISEVEK